MSRILPPPAQRTAPSCLVGRGAQPAAALRQLHHAACLGVVLTLWFLLQTAAPCCWHGRGVWLVTLPLQAAVLCWLHVRVVDPGFADCRLLYPYDEASQYQEKWDEEVQTCQELGLPHIEQVGLPAAWCRTSQAAASQASLSLSR